MYESSSSQFFRTITGIRSGPDAFDESRFNHLESYVNIMQFQISSRRENKQRDTRVIKFRVLRKFFSKQLCFIRCRRQHFWAVKWRRYSRFTFIENTISNYPKVPRAKFLGGPFYFSSIYKFDSFKNLFAALTSLSEL